MANNRSPSKDYRKFKPELRKEFQYSCAYCNIREPEFGGSRSFGIDHYRPKSKFPKLISVYHNLIYSCSVCNSRKGAYWPTIFERLVGAIVLEPRNDAVDMHIDKTSHDWKGCTKQGEWNIGFMGLSSPSLIQRREDRKKTQGLISEFTSKLTDISSLLEQSIAINNLDQISLYESKAQDLKETINVLRRQIEGARD